MKMFSEKLPAVLTLPIEWTDEDWAKPLVVSPPPVCCALGRAAAPRNGLVRRCRAGRHGRRGFTLIELLVVISIIGILAALLLPALATAKIKAKINAAGVDMRNIEAAVTAYQSTYTLAPVPKPLPNGANAAQDYSFSAGNSDVIVILMDVTNLVANANHARNPQRHAFLNAQLKQNTTGQGVSSIDYNFRDPWGNPYIIAFDLNYDNKVNVEPNVDPVYPTYPFPNIPRAVLVWSKGPPPYNKPIKSWE